MELAWFLVIGAVSGWLASQIWKGAGFGVIGNIIAGLVGGFEGGWLAGKVGIGGGGCVWQFLMATGAAWFVLFAIILIGKA